MSHLLDKIINQKLQIDPTCTEVENEIITLYWVFDSNLRFINKPTDLCNTFNISLFELRTLVSKRSTFVFYIHCTYCNSNERQNCTSQTNFNDIVSFLRGWGTEFKCHSCNREDELNRAKKKQAELKKQILSQNLAIENKVWKNLSDFDNEVLNAVLKTNNFSELKKVYWRKLGSEGYNDLFRALRDLEYVGLITLLTDEFDCFKIEDVQFLSRLVEEFDYRSVKKDMVNKDSQVEFNTETNEIRFKLTATKNRIHPDSPEFSGIVTFKKKIIIEPNVEYLFGHWQRSNNDMFLTMIPMEEIEKTPLQKRIESQPLPIRKKIEAFLNNIGTNYDL